MRAKFVNENQNAIYKTIDELFIWFSGTDDWSDDTDIAENLYLNDSGVNDDSYVSNEEGDLSQLKWLELRKDKKVKIETYEVRIGKDKKLGYYEVRFKVENKRFYFLAGNIPFILTRPEPVINTHI